ncbi:MAG: alpha-amylase family glycosyl hydrolase, partial [Myxococcota bacterium]
MLDVEAMPLPVLATYRVQLHAEFGFQAVAAQADYFAALGVSHVYCSPYLQAVPGSRHGYDMVDPARVSDELGGAEAHEQMCRRLAGVGLGQVLDVVPNHMAISADNRWWWDVLARGQESPYARFFDIDWASPEPKLRGRILLPVLADRWGRALSAGDVRLASHDGHLVVETPGHRWPLAAESVAPLLAQAAAAGGEEVAAVVNADSEALDALLRRQHYRLAHWRTAHRELDYRRFFDVNLLVGMCAEREDVFEAMHALPLRWVEEGRIDGLRIDHPDGLRDPDAYFDRLRRRAPRAWI